jgi:DNA-directed RNA polymerase beta' subunit
MDHIWKAICRDPVKVFSRIDNWQIEQECRSAEEDITGYWKCSDGSCELGKSAIESAEIRSNERLREADNIISRLVLKEISSLTNSIAVMVECGSKGNEINLRQINGCVGQQNVNQMYLNQRGFFGIVGASTPAFLVNGNHEQAAQCNLDDTAGNVAVWAQTSRNRFFPQPAPQT